MRKAALDALRAALNRLVCARSQQDVQMLRHNGEAVQLITSLISIMKERFDHQLGIRGSNEQRTPLVGRCRERIGFHGR